MRKKFPILYEVQGDTLAVSEDLHRSLNVLAGRFYKMHGYVGKDGFDFSLSEHPQEKMMYQMALEAAYMQLSTGALDE